MARDSPGFVVGLAGGLLGWGLLSILFLVLDRGLGPVREGTFDFVTSFWAWAGVYLVEVTLVLAVRRSWRALAGFLVLPLTAGAVYGLIGLFLFIAFSNAKGFH